MDMSNPKGSVSVSDSCFLKVENRSGSSPSRSPSPNTSIKGLSLFRMISRKIGKSARKNKEVTSSDEDEDSNSSSNSLSRTVTKKNGECDCDYFYKNERNILMLSAKNRSNSFTNESLKRDKARLSQEYHTRNERCLKFSTPCNGYHHSSGSDAYSSNDDSCNSNDGDQTAGVHFSSNDSSTSSSSGSYRNSRAIVRKVLKSLNLNSRSLSCSSISQMKEISSRDVSAKEKRTKKSPQKILRQPVTYTYVRGISGLPTHRVVNTRGCYNNQYSRG